MIDLCVACGVKTDVDRAHIRSRGAGGTWEVDNIIFLCRTHHRLQHNIGWPEFVKRNPKVERALKLKGWELVEQFGIQKLRHKSEL